jgi:hypothetical protein
VASTRRKWTIGGVLAGTASAVTILTFLASGNSPGPSSSQASDSYPVNVQANFLNACEASAPVSACQCTLTWFEGNVTLAQFEQDEATLEQTGQQPADLRDAVAACGG